MVTYVGAMPQWWVGSMGELSVVLGRGVGVTFSLDGEEICVALALS